VNNFQSVHWKWK